MEDCKIVINGRLPNLNDYIGKCRRNRYAGATMKKSNQYLVEGCIMAQCDGVRFENPVHIRFDFYEKNRRRDKDNIAAFAHKVVLDAMQSRGMIANDNWNGVDSFSDHFYVDADRPRIEVLIWEVENGKEGIPAV